jgi:hypothetical protein
MHFDVPFDVQLGRPGPVSWSAGLIVIEVGDVAYVCKWDELELPAARRRLPVGDTAALAQVIADEVAAGTVVQHPPHHLEQRPGTA